MIVPLVLPSSDAYTRADPQINEQIVLYVLGRTVLSFIPRLYSSSATAPAYPFSPLPHPLPPLTAAASNPRAIPPANLPFSVVAALSWAGVMYMFRHRGERLQPGMGASMSEFQRTAGEWMTGRDTADDQNTCITIPRLGMTFGRSCGITSERGYGVHVCSYILWRSCCLSGALEGFDGV